MVKCSTHVAFAVIYCVLYNSPTFCSPPPFLTHLREMHTKKITMLTQHPVATI